MKNYLLHIVIICCFAQQFHSQDGAVVAFDLPVRNSLRFNRYAMNPTFSFVKEEDQYISFTNKRQWSTFEDAPQTFLFSYSGKFRENMGVGIALFQQDYGVLTTFGGLANYAYSIPMGRESDLTFGLNAGFYNSGLNEGKVVTNFPDSSLDDLPSNSLIMVSPGINYGTEFFDFGVSVNNAALYNLTTSELVEDNPEQSIQAHAMYTGFLNGRGFFDQSKFSALVISEFKSEVTVVSGLLMLASPKGIWAQGGYNTLYGASAGLGINLTSQIAIEYNFEKGFGNFVDFGNSHEITVAYRFKRSRQLRSNAPEEESIFTSGGGSRRPAPKRKTATKIDAKAKEAAAIKKEAELEARKAAELEKQKRAEAQLAAQAEEQKRKEEEVAKEKQAEEEKAKLEREAQAKAEVDGEAKLEAEAKAAEEAVLKAKQQAEARAKAEAERKAQQAAEAKAERERIAKEAAQKKAKEEADAKARAEAERARVAKEAAEQRAREEAEANARAERERLAQEAADQKAREEEQAKQEAEAKAKAEQERLAMAAAEQKAREEAQAKQEAEAKAKAEQERLAKVAAEQKAREEAQAKAQEEAEALARKEAEQKAQQIANNPTIKAMDELTQSTVKAEVEQEELITKLEEKIATKRQDLNDMKRENDLSEQGIYTEPKPFKSLTAEKAEINALKSELDKSLEEQRIAMQQLEEVLITANKKKSSIDREAVEAYTNQLQTGKVYLKLLMDLDHIM